MLHESCTWLPLRFDHIIQTTSHAFHSNSCSTNSCSPHRTPSTKPGSPGLSVQWTRLRPRRWSIMSAIPRRVFSHLNHVTLGALDPCPLFNGISIEEMDEERDILMNFRVASITRLYHNPPTETETAEHMVESNRICSETGPSNARDTKFDRNMTMPAKHVQTPVLLQLCSGQTHDAACVSSFPTHIVTRYKAPEERQGRKIRLEKFATFPHAWFLVITSTCTSTPPFPLWSKVRLHHLPLLS